MLIWANDSHLLGILVIYTEEQLGVYVSAAESQRLSDLAEELRRELAAFTAEWEELMTQLEGA